MHNTSIFKEPYSVSAELLEQIRLSYKRNRLKLFITFFLLHFFIAAAPHAAEEEFIWQIICRVSEKDTVLEFSVSKKDVLISYNFKDERSFLDDRLSYVVIAGNKSSLSIHQTSIEGMYSGIFKMEWWNRSNPELMNSYWLANYWSGNGEVTTSIQKMNCKAQKAPTEYANRVFALQGRRD